MYDNIVKYFYQYVIMVIYYQLPGHSSKYLHLVIYNQINVNLVVVKSKLHIQWIVTRTSKPFNKLSYHLGWYSSGLSDWVMLS